MTARATRPRFLAIVAAVIERNGQYLLHQRPPDLRSPGKWEFPGGKIEANESPQDAVVRECREELGIRVRAGDVLDVITVPKEDEDPLLLIFIRATLEEGEPEPHSLEGGAVAWARGKALLDYDWLEADWPLVRRLAGE